MKVKQRKTEESTLTRRTGAKSFLQACHVKHLRTSVSKQSKILAQKWSWKKHFKDHRRIIFKETPRLRGNALWRIIHKQTSMSQDNPVPSTKLDQTNLRSDDPTVEVSRLTREPLRPNINNRKPKLGVQTDDTLYLDVHHRPGISPQTDQHGGQGNGLRTHPLYPFYEELTKQDVLCIKDPAHKLTDREINASQCILGCQFPHIGGFQDVSISRSPLKPNTNNIVIQPINTNPYSPGVHWVTFSKRNEAVCLYDSNYIPSMDIPPGISTAIAKMLRPNRSALLINKMPCSQQENETDCGVYAIAYATSLAFGDDPSSVRLANGIRLREHLSQCLSQRCFSRFPTDPMGALGSEIKHKMVQLCNSCYLPELPLHILRPCAGCDKKFHATCNGINNFSLIRNIFCNSCE